MGAAHVLTAASELDRYACSTLPRPVRTLAVLRPGDREAVIAAVKTAAPCGLQLHPINRGKNGSYDDVCPVAEDNVILDPTLKAESRNRAEGGLAAPLLPHQRAYSSYQSGFPWCWTTGSVKACGKARGRSDAVGACCGAWPPSGKPCFAVAPRSSSLVSDCSLHQGFGPSSTYLADTQGLC